MARHATLGFSDKANLDDGAMGPTSFALKKLTAADEARIAALVRKQAKAEVAVCGHHACGVTAVSLGTTGTIASRNRNTIT